MNRPCRVSVFRPPPSHLLGGLLGSETEQSFFPAFSHWQGHPRTGLNAQTQKCLLLPLLQAIECLASAVCRQTQTTAPQPPRLSSLLGSSASSPRPQLSPSISGLLCPCQQLFSFLLPIPGGQGGAPLALLLRTPQIPHPPPSRCLHSRKLDC